MHKSCNKS